MCGIVGFVDKEKKTIKKKVVKQMADVIKHRGPDGEGYFVDNYVALGHRRLSIIDLKKGGQPIYNEDKTLVVVFNGEIYNYQDLRKELEEKGHVFKTNTDTEVLVHGYEEYGTTLFSRLRGMFAFVIYNTITHELVGARDHFGIKPFYYSLVNDGFSFASEIKAILAYPNFPKEVNKEALKGYLIFQYSVYEETFFKGVFKLKPGHYFIYTEGKMEIQPFFEVSFENEEASYEDLKNELKETLESSIYHHQMTSDVEVGSYLSGGVDSSYVVSIAKPDKTFSVGFSVNGFDETDYAKDLSKLLHIKNKRKKISSDAFFDDLPTIQYYTDEPHANLSTVPLYFLSKLAREDVKVVLSGEGSDEMFGGYNEYLEPASLKIYSKVPHVLRKGVATLIKPLPHFPGKNTLVKYGENLSGRYNGHGTNFTSEEINRLLIPSLRSNVSAKTILRPYFEQVKDLDEVRQKMYIDMHFWLPQDILLKADRMTMANSLELRVPLLDKEVFSVARRIPSKYLVQKDTKHIFREIANEKIPSAWASRRKLGFPVPFSKWILEEKYYHKLKEAFNAPFVSEFFDREAILNLLEEHYEKKKNNGRLLYNIYVFLVWYKVYFE